MDPMQRENVIWSCAVCSSALIFKGPERKGNIAYHGLAISSMRRQEAFQHLKPKDLNPMPLTKSGANGNAVAGDYGSNLTAAREEGFREVAGDLGAGRREARGG